ncbi:Phospho-N-acetylmuramoyl-pentapeptide-transferase-like protein [Morus notabilis]|uniref:Phospho-N-acetylmuramoyl-pentapeptide-transferase-like protein n=1 Tax=Morus notabilis TaxID=981085 RepID=W9SER2_9ROSA|nr:Phospho-N-acetylmuramoyl-pentapeptide-transferase-like protein [Morus notabilis]
MKLHSHFHSPLLDLPLLSPPLPGLSRSSRLRFLPALPQSPPAFLFQTSDSSFTPKFSGSKTRRRARRLRRRHVRFMVFDEDSVDIPLLDDWGDNDETKGYVVSSSDDENSDTEFIVTPVTEVDLPTATMSSNNDALNVATHRLGMVGRGHKKHRQLLRACLVGGKSGRRDRGESISGRILGPMVVWTKYGVLLNTGLILFLSMVLVYVDWCAWRIVRLPLAPFHLTRPFLISAILASCAGYVCVPLLYGLKMYQIIRKEGPARHSMKKRTPTMGGLFFVPIGVVVAKLIAGSSCPEVSGAAAATLAFGAIGLLDDIFILIKNHSSGLSGRLKLLLELTPLRCNACQVAVGACFSFWLNTTSIVSPYGMKMLVPLPAPLGLVHLGKWYLMLTSFCLVSMGNGVNLTDGLDGLAGGTAALAFVGMSIAVLPICPDVSMFGASMAGACVGFLLHNRYRASVFMGDTGSLALGGALAAMAACTGMFFPLFISSGIFVVEASSVIMQVLYFKTTKYFQGAGHRLFQMAPIHHHLELRGIKEPLIVAGAYAVSSALALFAGYLGLISA